MGLYNNFEDVSGDSLPLLLLASLASSFSYLHSLVLRFLLLIPFSSTVIVAEVSDDALVAPLGSGLAGLVVLADHLASNPSFPYARDDEEEEECVVCLCGLRRGEMVRKLTCNHVFHKDCLDGWFHRMNLSCPLCRSSLASPETRAAADRRIGADVLACLSSSSF